MRVTATINDADFLPSYGIQYSIVILWATPESGRQIIFETFGSKKELVRKFGFSYQSKEAWDIKPVIKRKCEIELKDNKVRFVKYIE